MATQTSRVWVRLPNGRVHGPFSGAQVIAGWQKGKIAPGSGLSSSPEGPWKPIERCLPTPKAVGTASARAQGSPASEAAVPSALAPQATPAAAAPSVPSGPAASIPRVSIAGASGLPILEPGAAGPKGAIALLRASWGALRGRYWAVVARSFVTLLIVTLIGGIPVLLVLAAAADQALQLGVAPFFASLASVGILLDLACTFVLTPFAMMFACSGSYMILCGLRGSAGSGWSTLFAWKGRFMTMYAIGLLAIANDITGTVLGKLLAGGKGGGGIFEKFVQDGVENAPWAILVLAGMAVLDAGPGFGLKQSLRWAFDALRPDNWLGIIAVVSGALAAAILTAFLFIPGVLVGYPLLFVIISAVYARAPAPAPILPTRAA